MEKMKDYFEKLSVLDKDCQSNFASSGEDDGTAHDKEYQRIRSEALILLESAQANLPSKDMETFKQAVIEFLCENCGCLLDVEILDKYTPSVLSLEDREYINSHSALARWH